MKNILLALISLLIISTVNAEGWRPGEKQIVLTIENAQQAQVFKQLRLSYDALSTGKIRAYVVPKELEQLDEAGISYNVEIDDLKAFSQAAQLADDQWHGYQDIIDLADSLAQAFPDICEKIDFGQSLGGRQLAALKISDNVADDENEPEVMFDGGIHGDEYCGPENIIRFARDLCTGYNEDPDITFLINNREIWLYLMVNPDGRYNVVRYNNAGVDLNRDWQYMWDAWGGSPGPCSQVESKALRECMYYNQFVVHTTYHGGDECVSMPWSYRPDQPHDWNHINQLGSIYSSSSGYSNLPYYQGYNGMYAINGSTKDANYGIMGSISWSIELSMIKKPPASSISMYYQYNYPSMMALIEYAGYGLEGTVTDAVTGDPVAAVIFVNNFMPTFTDPEVGDYHKYVLAGTYELTVMANGYETQTISNVSVSSLNSTVTDIQLQPADGQYVYRFTASQIPDNNYSDEGWTPAVIGAPDMVNYSIGKNGWCVLDMQTPVIDGPGIDFIVYEGDSSPEGYTCYAGETMDGPWVQIGTGNGTTEFDLSDANVIEAQFIKIVDDGDGSATAPDAGFELDAIEALEPVSGVYIALYDYEIDDSQGNNNGRIDAGETVDIIVNLKNNGDITAENTVGTISTSSSWVTIDNNTASFGSLTQGQSEQGIFTVTANPATPEGQPFGLSMEVTANGGTYTNTYGMSFTIGLIVEDWESGTFDQFDWETGGDNNWTISTQNPYEGTYCVKSGDIGDEQSSYLSITFDVLANGEIGFYKKVSSESSYDYLKFYIDGNVVDQWSGEVSWSETSYPVTAGTHTFKWQYEKDYSVSNGSDCAWLDFITLPSGALNAMVAGFTADNTDICEGETVNFLDASSGDVISWEWAFEGGSPATSTFQNPTVAYFTAGTYDVSLTVSDGTDTQTITIENYIHVSAIPDIPTTPTGSEWGISLPGATNNYATTEVTGATSYEWMLDPAEAGEITANGAECTIDWTDYWIGDAYLSVKAMNDCGESAYSESKHIMVYVEGISEFDNNLLQIFPNPASEKINLTIDKSNIDPVNIKILDNKGVIVLSEQEKKMDGNSLLINLSDLSNGIYFLHLYNDELNIVKKIVIKK